MTIYVSPGDENTAAYIGPDQSMGTTLSEGGDSIEFCEGATIEDGMPWINITKILDRVF